MRKAEVENMNKNSNSVASLSLVALMMVIIFITARNDIRFNEERDREDLKKEIRDSVSRAQMDSMFIRVNVIQVQLDSIRCAQIDYCETEERNFDVIKKSLNQFEKKQRQLLNLMK